MSIPAASVTLTDDAGDRCYIERSSKGSRVRLLLPVDSAIEIFAWQSDGGGEAIPVEDDATINQFDDRCPR